APAPTAAPAPAGPTAAPDTASSDTAPLEAASSDTAPLEAASSDTASSDATAPDAAAAPPPGAEFPVDEDEAAHSARAPSLPLSDLERAEGLTIERIEVTGNRRVASGDIQSYLRQKVGEPLRGEQLRRDVRELWRAGFFDDIEVDLRQSATGAGLRFHVKERPAIRAVEFEGNEELKSDDLAEAIEVKVDTILSPPALRRAIQKIRDMYAEEGYFLAEANYRVTSGRNNEVTVKFVIKEHSQVSVRRITFIGNEQVSTEELRRVMFTGNPGFFAFGSGGPFRQDAFERDIAMISALYYDRGFLQVGVNTPRVMLTPDKSGMEVSVTIEEGPRFRIRQLRVLEQGADGQEVEPIGGRRALRLMVRGESGDYFNRAQLL